MKKLKNVFFASFHRWTPKNERSMTTAFIYSGSQIGTVIIMPVTGFLANQTFLGNFKF